MDLITDNYYISSVIATMAIATFFCRSLPFFAFKGLATHPIFLFIGKNLPPMIMILLVLYGLSESDYTRAPYGLNELLALGLTVIIHLRFKNALLSIGLGTATYMILKQTGLLIF